MEDSWLNLELKTLIQSRAKLICGIRSGIRSLCTDFFSEGLLVTDLHHLSFSSHDPASETALAEKVLNSLQDRVKTDQSAFLKIVKVLHEATGLDYLGDMLMLKLKESHKRSCEEEMAREENLYNIRPNGVRGASLGGVSTEAAPTYENTSAQAMFQSHWSGKLVTLLHDQQMSECVDKTSCTKASYCQLETGMDKMRFPLPHQSQATPSDSTMAEKLFTNRSRGILMVNQISVVSVQSVPDLHSGIGSEHIAADATLESTAAAAELGANCNGEKQASKCSFTATQHTSSAAYTHGHTNTPSTAGHTPSTDGHTASEPGHPTSAAPSAVGYTPSVDRSIAGHAPSTTGHTPSTAGHMPQTSELEHPTSVADHTPSIVGYMPPSTAGHAPETAGHTPSTACDAPSTAGHTPSTAGHTPETAGCQPSEPGHPTSVANHTSSTVGHTPTMEDITANEGYTCVSEMDYSGVMLVQRSNSTDSDRYSTPLTSLPCSKCFWMKQMTSKLEDRISELEGRISERSMQQVNNLRQELFEVETARYEENMVSEKRHAEQEEIIMTLLAQVECLEHEKFSKYSSYEESIERERLLRQLSKEKKEAELERLKKEIEKMKIAEERGNKSNQQLWQECCKLRSQLKRANSLQCDNEEQHEGEYNQPQPVTGPLPGPFSHPHQSFSQPHQSFSQPHPPFSQPHPPFSQPHPPFSQPHPSLSHPYLPLSQPHLSFSQPHPSLSQPRPPLSKPHTPLSQSHPPFPQPHMPFSQPCLSHGSFSKSNAPFY